MWVTKRGLERHLILAGLCLGVAGPSAISGERGAADEAAEIRIAAEAGLRQYLAAIPRAGLEACGIPAAVPAEQISLGHPFPVHALSPAAAAGAEDGTAVDEILAPVSVYYVPVRAGGAIRAILIVDRVNGEWKTVSLGHPVIGMALGRLSDEWPAGRGFRPRLVVVPQANELLFTIPEVSRTNLTRLAGAGGTDAAAFASSPGALTGLRDVLPRLSRSLTPAGDLRLAPGRGEMEGGP